jgi:hypothetical protein
VCWYPPAVWPVSSRPQLVVSERYHHLQVPLAQPAEQDQQVRSQSPELPEPQHPESQAPPKYPQLVHCRRPEQWTRRCPDRRPQHRSRSYPPRQQQPAYRRHPREQPIRQPSHSQRHLCCRVPV